MKRFSGSQCPICNQESNSILTQTLRRGDGKVLHCQGCDHGFLVQKASFDIKKFYAEEYRQEYSHRAAQAVTNPRELFDVYKNYQGERLGTISSMLRPEIRVLEVGASAGQFLWHIKDRVKEVHAIELDKACRSFLEDELEIPADDEYLENSKFADHHYDLVCAFQVLEHVDDPVKFLHTLVKVTSPGGRIVVEVPNLYDPLLSVWNVPTYETFYYHSAHLHYFSRNSLRAVALEAGFNDTDIQISHTQDYNLLNHLHWIMNDTPQQDCHTGLGPIVLKGRQHAINTWLSKELEELNYRYCKLLSESGFTSNMIMRLKRV